MHFGFRLNRYDALQRFDQSFNQDRSRRIIEGLQ